MRALRSFGSVLVLSCLMAPAAYGQLGGLRKIGIDAIKDAAKKPENAQESKGAKVDYTITEERATAIIAALTPMVERAKKEKAFADAKAAYEAKQKPVNECLQKVGSNGGMPDMAGMQNPAFQSLSMRAGTYGSKATQAQTAKNYRAAVAYADSGIAMQLQATAIMFSQAKCGAYPYKPAALIDAEAEQMARMAAGSSGDENSGFQVAPDKRAGMTTGQFGRIREAIAIWTLQRAGQLPATAYKFTDAEAAVLTAKSAQLTPMAPYFKSGFLTWLSWGDITSW